MAQGVRGLPQSWRTWVWILSSHIQSYVKYLQPHVKTLELCGWAVETGAWISRAPWLPNLAEWRLQSQGETLSQEITQRRMGENTRSPLLSSMHTHRWTWTGRHTSPRCSYTYITHTPTPTKTWWFQTIMIYIIAGWAKRKVQAGLEG